MKKYFCDIPGCDEEAYSHDIDVCDGYTSSSKSSGMDKIYYEPFERPSFKKVDLCKKHLKEWCKLTYQLLYNKVD